MNKDMRVKYKSNKIN